MFESNNLNPDEVHLNGRFYLNNMYIVIRLYEVFFIYENRHGTL